MDILGFILGVGSSLIASQIDKKFNSGLIHDLNIIATEFTNLRGSKAFGQLFISEHRCDGNSKRSELVDCINRFDIPSKDLILDSLLERWENVREEIPETERADFFNLPKVEVVKILDELSMRIDTTFHSHPEFLRSALQGLEKRMVSAIRKEFSHPNQTSIINTLFENSLSDSSKINSIFPNTPISVSELFINPVCEITNIFEETTLPLSGQVTSFINEKLSTQNIIFVLGGYGSGKSILLRKLAMDNFQAGKNVIFCSGRNWKKFLNTSPEIESLRKELGQLHEATYLFVDSLEDCVDIKANDGERYSWASLCDIFSSLSKVKNLKIIVSMRDIFPDIEQTCNYFTELYDCEGDYNDEYVYLNPFKSEERKEWVNNYLQAIKKSEQSYKLNLFLKNKNTRDVSSNPLSLFVLSEKLMSESQSSDVIDICEYYDFFVEKTVKGKFHKESRVGANFLNKHDLVKEYRNYLKNASATIFNNSIANKREINSDIDYSSSWPIDPNKIIFTSSYEKVRNISSCFIEKNTSISLKTEQQKNEVMSSLLSCYFFYYNDNEARFKDNNVLHYFLSEYFLEQLIYQSKLFIKLKENYRLEQDKLNLITGITIEFLIWRINRLNIEDSTAIRTLICHLLYKRFYESDSDREELHLSRNSITLEIIFYILALKLNWLDNELNERPLVPMADLVKYDELFKLGYKSLLYRNLSKCSFNGSKFEHHDLSDYNFSHSRFYNSSFINCSFHDTLFESMSCDNLTFTNCNFKNVNFDNVRGKMFLKDCTFNNVSFRKTLELSLKINGGRIIKVNFTNSLYKREKLNEIKNNKTKKKTAIDISMCMVKQLSFSSFHMLQENSRLLLDSCFVGNFTIKKSKIYIRVINSYNSGNGEVESSNRMLEPEKDSISEVIYL
ncbi:pentapeptide repeat-containing protein [Pseudoalteromonas sp. McH1-7]|uniref:pentapeptide repeat-containing protein n=1 Tax=Pseudoalteromonas sp. McH1-7 TaxID=2745574 RepID=UPI001590782C|nr:pentapeptide repeat-containing protein [Pseudoalteromonas sp. McH1-7]NUZ10308.1 pentapeptide repeat-containing protein [Pseudoalteromonas sp. McH1-7]